MLTPTAPWAGAGDWADVAHKPTQTTRHPLGGSSPFKLLPGDCREKDKTLCHCPRRGHGTLRHWQQAAAVTVGYHNTLIRGNVTSWAELHVPIGTRTRPRSDISVPTGSAAGLGTGEMGVGNDGGERGAEGEDPDGRCADGASAKGSLPRPPRQPLVLKPSSFPSPAPFIHIHFSIPE